MFKLEKNLPKRVKDKLFFEKKSGNSMDLTKLELL